MGCSPSTMEGVSAKVNDIKTAALNSTLHRVLVLRNAVTGAASYSNQGVDTAKKLLLKTYPNVVFIERDLVKDQVPFLTEETCAAIRNGVQTTATQVAITKLSDKLIEEIKSVDLIIVGLPRYNFGCPTSFKTYLDVIARPRVTFGYTTRGESEGYLPNIPVWLVMSAGGEYGGDYYNDWLNVMLPFIGLKTINFLPIEGTSMGTQSAGVALAKHEENVETAMGKLKLFLMANAGKNAATGKKE